MAAGNPVFLLCPHSTQQLQFSIGIPDLHTPDSLYGDDSASSSYVPFLTSSSKLSSSSSSSCSSSTSTPDQESVALPGCSSAALTVLVPSATLTASSGVVHNARSVTSTFSNPSSAFLARSNEVSTAVRYGASIEDWTRRDQSKGHWKQKNPTFKPSRTKNERRPDNLMFARPEAVPGGAKMTRSSSRRAKLSRVNDTVSVAGGSSHVHGQQTSTPLGRHPPSDSRPSTLALPSQTFSSIPPADSFSQRLLAGAVEAAQHLEETLAHVTDPPANSSYLDIPLNYELYLASSSQGQSLFPARSNGVDATVNSLNAQDYLPRFDVQRSLPLPPISTIRGIHPQQQHHHVGFVFDASVGQYPLKDVSHIPRNQGEVTRLFDKFSSSRNKILTAADVPTDEEVIVIDDEAEQTACDDATPVKSNDAAPSHEPNPPQSTSTVTNSSHKPTAASLSSFTISSTASGNVKSIYSHKDYLFPCRLANNASDYKSTCDRSRKYLRIDSNPSIVDGCLLESQGRLDQQVKPSDKNQSRITESGFNFSPAYLSSRRAGFDFGASNLGRNAGVSLDATLERQAGVKQSCSQGHPFGDGMAKPHYSSDDTLVTPSVFVFPSSEQVEISYETEAADHSLRALDQRSGRAKVSSSKKPCEGHTLELTPVSPPGKPPLAETCRTQDGLQTFQLLVNENGSVCPKTQEEGKKLTLSHIDRVFKTLLSSIDVSSRIALGYLQHY
ncbi:hypothetical protein RRG08_048378 [Elysia crispata]|uniref:Uncharacterized protein n=1 Tax=Elysia crispata TaxID=231223 RepID=A0AAE1BA70_9GAST|nr:hypothetical protein RRG08_048378 [Elysia crispata]